MTDYVTADELRAYIGSDTTNFQTVAETVVTVASRAVEQMCDRYFYQDGTVTARYYPVSNPWYLCVDDISTSTGLLVAADDAYAGTYTTAWTVTTDFTLAPVNPSKTGTTWPYNEILSTTTKAFPPSIPGRMNTVRVSAKWGWAAVPADVKQATLMHAAWLFKQKDAADGFVGLDGWGPTRSKPNAAVQDLLGPYMKSKISVA